MKKSSTSFLHPALLLFCAALAQAPSLAGGTEPPDIPDEYSTHVEAGNRLSADKNYAGALNEFEKAYSIAQRARLLINIGRCLYRLGRLREALAKYERFERAEPDADAETRIRVAKYKEDALRALVSGNQNSSTSQNSDTRAVSDAKKADSETIRPSATTLNNRLVSQNNEQLASISRVPPKPASALVGIGAIMLLGGAGVGIATIEAARTLGSTSNQNHIFDADLQRTQSQGQIFNGMSIALDVIGGVTLASGATWMIVWHTQRKNKLKLALSPSIRPLAFSGSF